MYSTDRFKSTVFSLFVVFAISAVSVATAQDPSEIPPGAEETLGVPDPQNGLLISDLGRGLYVATELASPVYQAMFLIGHDGVILVDAPPTLFDTDNSAVFLRTNLLGAIRDLSRGKRVKQMVYSHPHVDHIGAAGKVVAANPDVRIYAHKDARDELAAANDPRRPIPNRTFRDSRFVWQGGQLLKLKHTANFHSKGDILVYAPFQKTIMVVDAIFPNWVPFANLALTENVREFIRIHDTILSFRAPVRHFVGGHLTRVGTLRDVQRAKEYVEAVQTAAGLSLADLGPSFPLDYFGFGPSPFNVFDHFLDDVVQQCTERIVDGSLGDFSDLGALTVFTDSHCFTMQNYLRLEK